MAVNKIDPKVIFASEAPSQDVPAVFTNKTVGWGESRKNGGRPTIKQANALQQETDLKILWLNENSVSPFDATIDYPVNAVTIKDGAFKIFNGSVWNLFLNRASVGLSNVNDTSDTNKPISTATAAALDLKADKSATYTKSEVNAAIAGATGGPYLAAEVLDGNQTQDQINLFGGKKYDMSAGSYPLNARVLLNNGNIVKSTIPSNTNNPNTDMTGWVKDNSARQILDESGLSQQQVTNGVNSIADLLAIQNPKHGNTQRVLSFDAGYGVGGGHFTYDETKATINNGVTIFNGWERNCNPRRIKASYAGLRGDVTQDIRIGFKNLSDYLLSLNQDMKKHLKIDAGIYQILTIQRYDAGQASYCTFAAVNNLSIVGDGKESTVFRFPDWVLDKIEGNEVIRDFAVFSDNQRNIKNFSVNHVGFDFNADNNYYRTDEESNNPLRKAAMAFKFVGYEFKNLDFSDNRFYRNPFYNSIIVIAYKKPDGTSSVNVVKANRCDFIRGGDGANLGLNKVHDHSAIFLAGRGLEACNNTFINVKGSNVSCGIEMHNFGIMNNNYFENYSVPLHAVSEEDMGCDIIANSNIAMGAVYGLSHNCKDADSTISYTGNKIQLRGEKAVFLPSNNGLTFRHSGYESGGGVNNATALHNHDTKVYLKDNVFEQLPPTGGWEWSDNIINACMTVKETQLFDASGNTFIGFQGAALEILTQSGHQLRSNTRIVLRDNTYIRCGFSNNNADGFGDFNSAYRITGNSVDLPYDLGVLDVQGDKFIECKYGALVGNYLPEVFMNKISVSDVKVSGGFINPIFMKTSHINLQSACSISYSYLDTQDTTYLPVLLSKGNVAFDLNITQEDAYSKPYFELQYKKTFSNPAVHLNAKGYGQVSETQQIGFFSQTIGDTYTPLDVSFDQFSKFYYANVSGVNQWCGVSKVQ